MYCISFRVIENPKSGFHPGWSLRRGRNSQEKIWDQFVYPSIGKLTYSVYRKGQTHAYTCTHIHTHTHIIFYFRKKNSDALASVA